MWKIVGRVPLMLLAGVVASVGIFAVVKSILGWPQGGMVDNAGLLASGTGLVVALLLVEELAGYARQRKARVLAARLGLRYSSAGSRSFAERLGESFFTQTDRTLGDAVFAVENVVQGALDGRQICVCDLMTSLSSGESTKRFKQTIVRITHNGEALADSAVDRFLQWQPGARIRIESTAVVISLERFVPIADWPQLIKQTNQMCSS
ncbi:MAG: hypothetical protein ACE361_21750 [Aureliella sp.]